MIKYTSYPVFLKKSLAVAYTVLYSMDDKAYRHFEDNEECVYLYDVMTNIDQKYENDNECKKLSWPILETFTLDDIEVCRFEIDGVSYWTLLSF